MRSRKLVDGIGVKSPSLPDYILDRALLDRLTAGPAPGRSSESDGLRIIRRSWDLELGVKEIPEAWASLQEALGRSGSGGGWRQIVLEDWKYGRDGLLEHPTGALLNLTLRKRELIGGIYTFDARIAEQALERVERVILERDQRHEEAGSVQVRFWLEGSDGPSSYERRLPCPTWEEIKENYPEGNGCRQHLAWLMQLRQPHHLGHFIFWHGEPGTGKTFAVRALIREWEDMAIEVITDPDAFLSNPEYLNEVVLHCPDKVCAHGGSGDSDDACGRLIILEDAPDLVLDTGAGVGRASLSKLLNVSDGLVGQGHGLVFLATTHEPGAVPESALHRPGRSLQVQHFRPLQSSEVKNWFERRQLRQPDALPNATLAELYSLQEHIDVRRHVPRPVLGFGSGR